MGDDDDMEMEMDEEVDADLRAAGVNAHESLPMGMPCPDPIASGTHALTPVVSICLSSKHWKRGFASSGFSRITHTFDTILIGHLILSTPLLLSP